MTTYFSTKINDLTPRRPIDPFKGFGLPSEKRNEICEGMSPEEIAEIVSDRIIEVIQKQFKETEERFKEMAKKK